MPEENELCNSQAPKGPCCMPKDEPPKLSIPPMDKEKPVGLMIDPHLVGDLPRHPEENLRFYPCKVKERQIGKNLANFTPQCPRETTYQRDFAYKGKDSRRCRTYEFRTEAGREKCDVFYCVPPSPKPSPNYGRRTTDVKPVEKSDPSFVFGNRGSHGSMNSQKEVIDYMDPKNRISEYMGSVSKLGSEIIGYNLFGMAARKAERARRGVKDYRENF